MSTTIKKWETRQSESQYSRTAESCMLDEIADLRAALAAREGQQEPVTWYDASAPIDQGEMYRDVRSLTISGTSAKFGNFTTPLYAAPVAQQSEAGEPADLPWHDAVLAECMKIETGYQSADPVATIKAVIDWHVQEASGVADGIKVMADNYMRLTCGTGEAGAPTASAGNSDGDLTAAWGAVWKARALAAGWTPEGRESAAPLAKQDAPAFDPVVEANRKLLLERSHVGMKKYGTTLAAAGLSRAQLAQHALEEALDLANYLQTIIQTEEAQHG